MSTHIFSLFTESVSVPAIHAMRKQSACEGRKLGEGYRWAGTTLSDSNEQRRRRRTGPGKPTGT
jgi:hypothetical protein